MLKNPTVDAQDRTFQGWHDHVRNLPGYTALSAADGEDPVLDSTTGLALFGWLKDVLSGQDLQGFDLLLMTANEPTLNTNRQYATAEQVASAWRADLINDGRYFYNNRHEVITTFEDDAILEILRGDLPVKALQPPSGERKEEQI